MQNREMRAGARNGLHHRAAQASSFARYVVRRFGVDNALGMAASLSYTSLFSLVPLLAVALAILSAFPVFNHIRDQLRTEVFRYFVPEVGEQVNTHVSAFLGNVGKLTATGVLGLALTAVMVLVTIERALNVIFRVTTARKVTSRLLVYWTGLTLGPLLLGTAFSLSAWLFALSHWMGRAGLTGLVGVVTRLAPNILMVAAFALMFMAVPNRKVRPLDALVGGVVTELVFAVLRSGFSTYIATTHAYQSIYGAVAVAAIFLFWMYLSWAAVLFGAEITAALPEWRLERHSLGAPPEPRRQLEMALTVLGLLLAESQGGGKGRTRRGLLDAVAEAEKPFQQVLDRLIGHGYVVKTDNDRYVLGRDLSSARLGEVVAALGLGLGAPKGNEEGASVMRRAAESLEQAARVQAEALDIPLRPLLEPVAPEAALAGRRRG